MIILCDEKRNKVLGQRINPETRRTEKIILNPNMDLEEIFSLKTEIIAFNTISEAEGFLMRNQREVLDLNLYPLEIIEIENNTEFLRLNPIVLMKTIKNFVQNFRNKKELIFYIKHINKYQLDLRYIIGNKSYKIVFEFDDALELQEYNKKYMRKFIPREITGEKKYD